MRRKIKGVLKYRIISIIPTSCEVDGGDTCDLKIRIKMCVEFPVNVGAIAKTGEVMIECDTLSIDVGL